ncbi:hypothetical protein J2X45_000987 [Caulobacter sp. BE264]|uniref:hypothetical protein n=1 Tax=Caulobacter sp. BE264 TaxID=2817724 RepID=UPI00285F0247|nr:hypothetical protein [Caulobacter sp. BE264]MDR7229924.1 hypothetical protein [Caulobacter sp. BE264]
MLMALLVVRAPAVTVDRLLHDTGQVHSANAFAGALVDLHEHEQEAEHAQLKSAADQEEVDADGGSSALHHHHHHDSPSIYGLPEGSGLMVTWSSSPLPFRLNNDLRQGIDALLQDRPPKALLVYVA